MKRCNYVSEIFAKSEEKCRFKRGNHLRRGSGNFSYVLKKFDDIVLEHRNLTRFRKRVKIDSTVEVVQRFDFVHNFV